MKNLNKGQLIWINRIVGMLEGASGGQLREIYYIILGYLYAAGNINRMDPEPESGRREELRS